MRIGVFLPNWIGDAVMATPAVRSLRGLAGEGGALVGIAKPLIREVYAGLDSFESFVDYHPKRSRGAICREIRNQKLDTVVLFPNSIRSGWIALRSGVRERIGYHRPLRGVMLTTQLREPRRRGRRVQIPTIDHYLQLAYAAGGDYEPPRLELATSAEDEQAADRAWDELGLPTGDRVIVLNSGGAFGASKRWPDESFAELAQRIYGELGMAVLVNCGPAEQELARRVVRLAACDGVVSLAGRALPIGLTKAVIRRSRLLVTTDSGPRFFGVAFGKPVVSLFGPTEPRHSRTHYPLESTLTQALDCQPCWKSACPLSHHRCMQELSVTRVYEQVKQMLVLSAGEWGPPVELDTPATANRRIPVCLVPRTAAASDRPTRTRAATADRLPR